MTESASRLLGGAAQSAAGGAASSAHDSVLAVRLRHRAGGPVLDRESVTRQDLVDPVAELWFEAYLRRGRTDVALGSVRAALRPLQRRGEAGGPPADRCLGFELSTDEADGSAAASCRFLYDSLGHVAARAARRLVERGVLEAGSVYYYDLAVEGDPGEPCWIHGPEGRGTPELRPLPLGPLLERAEPAGEASEAGDYPVLLTRRARERAERVARAGAADDPPVETGGLFVGPLCRCPDSGEVFAVVLDVLEATDSVATTHSMTFSGRTWSRIQTLMRARQAHPPTRHHRILGQLHGHNFLPLGGAEPCEACHALPVCTRTTAVLSEDDRVWCRSVFCAEPWQISMIFGHDARSRRVEAFYGQQGGGLVRRGYQLIDEVDELMEAG